MQVILSLHAVAHIPEAHGTGHILQFTVAIGGASEAVEGVVGNIEFHHALAQLVEARGLGVDRHAFCARGGAGSGCTGAAFNLDQAQPAGTKGVEVIGRAELGNVGADHGRGAHHRGALGHAHRHAVDVHRDLYIRLGPGGAEIL